MQALAAGGAEVALCAANPLTTQDEVAAALREDGCATHGRRGEDADAYVEGVVAVVDERPQVTLDDGADLLTFIHAGRTELLPGLVGGTEETTTGLVRLRALEARVPGHRGQRGAHRAALQRPLRHGPVDARRHPARDQPAARGQDDRRARLRLDGQGRRAARPRRRRAGDRLRDRPDAGARGADGGLRGHARAGRGRARRRVRDRHGLARRPRRGALRAHEGRRGARQRRALRRGDRPRGRCTARRPSSRARCCRS